MNLNRITTYMTLFVLCGWGLFSCGNKTTETEENATFPIRVNPVERASKAHIRGLFLVDDKVGWASGAGGTFLRMTDGEKWSADTISGYTHLDFRDVHGFDENTALLMAAGEEGRILRTEDGGVSWVEVYTRLDSGIFLDGMDFHNNVGYCYGDPIDGKFVLVRTDDYGKTWHDVPAERLPDSSPNEAGFAASGTGIAVINSERVDLLTGGGQTPRLLTDLGRSGNWTSLPIGLHSGEGCGGFSIAYTGKTFVAVGGCYLDSSNQKGNCSVFAPGKKSFEVVEQKQPKGYRSCVDYSHESNLLVTCGRTGIDYSLDNGFSWIPVSEDGYYTCSLADSTGWLMGRGGKMAKLSW